MGPPEEARRPAHNGEHHQVTASVHAVESVGGWRLHVEHQRQQRPAAGLHAGSCPVQFVPLAFYLPGRRCRAAVQSWTKAGWRPNCQVTSAASHCNGVAVC